MGLLAWQHVGSFWIKDLTHVSCIGRRILNHWTTRETQHLEVFTLEFLRCFYIHCSLKKLKLEVISMLPIFMRIMIDQFIHKEKTLAIYQNIKILSN